MSDEELIENAETWIRLHEHNEYQREAAKRMKALVVALREHTAPTVAVKPSIDEVRRYVEGLEDWEAQPHVVEELSSALDDIPDCETWTAAPHSEHTAPTDEQSALTQVLLAWAGPWEGPRKPSLLELLQAAGFRRGAPADRTSTPGDFWAKFREAEDDGSCPGIGAPAEPAVPTARVVPNDPTASACAAGYCPQGCSHMMWKCDTCQCEGGWGAPTARLEDFAREHVCPQDPPAEPAVTVTDEMVERAWSTLDNRYGAINVTCDDVRAALEVALNATQTEGEKP